MDDLGPRSFRRRVLWLLLAASLLSALPSLRGSILSYDDRNLLLGSEGAFARSPGSFFTGLYYYAYLPFYGLSYWIDGQLGGQNPVLVHVGNVLWHAATSYLVFCVLALLLRHFVAACFGALLFAVHPVHVESVAWISGRKEVLSAFFLFLAWLLQLRERRGWALASFLVACFCKATAVVLPVLMLAAALLLPRYEHQRRRAARATLPLFLAALVPVAVHLWVGVGTGVVRETDAWGARAWSGVVAWGRSLWHSLVPVGLSIDYPEARRPSFGAGLGALLGLMAALGAAWAWRRRAPVASFGIAAFFVALAPHNGLFPATDVAMADRYLYVAIFGFSAAAAGLAALDDRGRVALGLLAVGLVVLSLVSSSRFRSDEQLWTATIASRDASALAYFQRGTTRFERSERATPPDQALRAQAIQDLDAALARAVLKEHKLKANAALILPLVKAKRIGEALERASDAFDLLAGVVSPEAPRFRAELYYHRGIAYNARADYALAAADFRASGELWGRYQPYYEQGIAWLRAGQPDWARAALERAAAIRPELEEPWIFIAQAARMRGDAARYRWALEEASRRAPQSGRVAAEWVRFWLYGASPNFRRAREALKKLPPASRRRTRLEGRVEAQHALYLFRRGKRPLALRAADTARKLGLDDPARQYDLGQIYLEAQRYDDAVQCFKASADLLANSAVQREAVARAYALKAASLLAAGKRERAEAAMRAALDARPRLIEAGAAPLRGEISLLRETGTGELLLLAAAVVAGNPATARAVSDELLARELSAGDRALTYRLRALLRAFSTYDFKGAEDDLNQVLAHHPDDAWARYRLAQVWTNSGVGWMRTAEQLESAARRDQGRALIRRAIELLDRLLDEDPEFDYARLQRGQAYFSLGRLEEAKADYVRVRESDPGIKEVFVREAVLHRLSFVKGGSIETLDSAQAFLERALQLDPNYFDALYELGNDFHLRYDRPAGGRMGRREAFVNAVLWYRRAMALNPRVRGPRLEWARLLLKAGREAIAAGEIVRAHELLQRLEQDAGNVAEVHKQRVRLNLAPNFGSKTGLAPDRFFGAAGRALQRLEELVPDDPELPALRSLYHRSRGQSYFLTWGKYMTAARIARQKEDERAETFQRKADRAKQLAVEQWRQALTAWPQDPDNRMLREQLRSLAPGFIQQDREQAKAAYERGIAAYKAQRYEEAAAAFGKAVQLVPEWVELRFFHGLALARSGQLEAARPELERVANHKTESSRFPEAMFELGNIFRVKRSAAVARLWYGRFVESMAAAGRGGEPEVDLARKILRELK